MKKILIILIPCLFFIPAVWALFIPGYFGASDDLHIAWLYEFHRSLLAGQIPPRFVPDLSFGFGYPLFNFVFPLPFYIAELLHLTGFSLVDSIKGVFFLSMIFSGIFMYYFLRQYTSALVSFTGAVIYTYTPYRSVDMYIRGAIGEVLSFAFLPLIILAVSKIKETGKLRWVGVGGISLACLILSHNITSYMFFPFVALFILLNLIFSFNKIFLTHMILMGVLGLLISIYFWLPAILESNLVRYDTVFNFIDHHPTLIQLVKPYWGYGASVPGPYDGMSFFLGVGGLTVYLLGSVSLFLYWRKITKDQKIILIWSQIVILTSIFMMNFRSTFVWQNVPLISFFQFPWRFLMMTTFCMPILIISAGYLKKTRLIMGFLIILTLLTTASNFRPEDFLGRTDSYYLNRYVPYPIASEEYLKTGEEYLRLPVNTDFRPDKNYPLVSPEAKIKNIVNVNALHTVIETNSDTEFLLDYNKYLFPGWVVRIDGVETVPMPGVPFGQINILIPGGTHKVEVNFEETGFKKILDVVSLGSILVSLLLLMKLKTKYV